MYEYMLIELPHDRKTTTKVADENVETVPQINAILNELAQQGWQVVSYSDSFTSAGSRRWPRVLLRRPKGDQSTSNG